MPLIDLPLRPAPDPAPDPLPPPRPKSSLAYLPLLLAVFLLLLPHPSYTLVLTFHYARHAPVRFALHLLAVHTFTLLALTSLMVCVVRDPGAVRAKGARATRPAPGRHAQPDDGVTASLLREDADGSDAEHGDASGDGALYTGRWCARCRLTRPERAHHCTTCGRCILKMDHHCPWLGGNCIGHRTYPAFLHFLLMATLLAAYVACVSLSVTINLIKDPFSTSSHVSPLHALFLVLAGAIFTLTMASFLAYHLYLVSTNQTTLEHMSPFFVLRYIPPRSRKPPSAPPASLEAPAASGTRAFPPYTTHPPTQDPRANSGACYAEHTLSAAQRRLVQHAHGRVRPYDLGVRRNWGAVFGGGCGTTRGRAGGGGEHGSGSMWMRWGVVLMVCGGRPRGDGWAFERGRGVREGLERLWKELEEVGRRERREEDV